MDTTQLQNIPPHSFPIKHVIFLCEKIIGAKYPTSFNDSGSLATVRDLPFMVTTNLFYKFGGEDGCIIIQKENVFISKPFVSSKVDSNEAHDVFNKGHHHGAYDVTENRPLSRPRPMCSTEMHIAEDSATTLIDVLGSNIQTPEQVLRHQESYDLATFIDMLTVNTSLNESFHYG